MRVGMDLDGVVHDWNTAYIKAASQLYGVALEPSTSWDSFKNQMEAAGVPEMPFHPDTLNGTPYPGALEVLRALAEVADLVLITSRPVEARQATYAWLAKYDVPTSEVHILHSRPKSSVACDVYVDDGPHNITDLLNNTRADVLLLDRPWNKDYHCGGRARRVYSLDEALEGIQAEVLA